MTGVRILLALLVALTLVAGCASTGPSAAQLADADRRLDIAQLAMGAKEWTRAWNELKPLREIARSDKGREAFELASVCYRTMWGQTRFADPDAAWHHDDRIYFFEWAALYFEAGQPYPETEANLIVRGLPRSFAKGFLRWTEGRPEFEGLDLRLHEDNGTVKYMSNGEADPEILDRYL